MNESQQPNLTEDTPTPAPESLKPVRVIPLRNKPVEIEDELAAMLGQGYVPLATTNNFLVMILRDSAGQMVKGNVS